MADDDTPEKGEYELLRDARVKEIEMRFGSVKRAAEAFKDSIARERGEVRQEGRSAPKAASNFAGKPPQSASVRRPSAIMESSRERSKAQAESPPQPMSSESASASDATRSDYDPEATENEDYSSKEELPPSSTLSKQKRSRKRVPSTALTVMPPHAGQSSSQMPPPGYWGPSPWGQSWMPQAVMPTQSWHGGTQPGPLPYTHAWPSQYPPMEVRSPESEARVSRRHKRRKHDVEVAVRQTVGLKPHQLHVKAGGEIDNTCEGKNAWDNAVRVSTPRILDMSIVDWESQKPAAVALLREMLDADFEYVGHTLSSSGFRAAIKKYLKAERGRLKARWAAGIEHAPVHIDGPQWEKLKIYWGTTVQQEKTAKMQLARSHVKDYTTMGRKGRAGKELLLREGKEESPGITEVADFMVESRQAAPPALSATAAVRSRLNALEEKHKDMEGKMTQMLLSQSENTSSLDEVKRMLSKCMDRLSSSEQFVPSIGISAVDTQGQLDSTKMPVVGAERSNQFKTPATVISKQVSEGSGDSDTVKGAPKAAAAKDLTPIVELDPIGDGKTGAVVQHDVDMVSNQTPAAVSALVHLGGNVEKADLSSKPPAVGEDVGEAGVVDSPVRTTVEVPVQPESKESEEEEEEKEAQVDVPAADPKRPPRGRRLKKVIESNTEDSPESKCGKTMPEVVELSPSCSPAGISSRVRASPRKQPAKVNSSAEANAAAEEDLEKAKIGKREPKAKVAPKKKPGVDKLVIGQEVFLLNPKNVKQSVATGVISGLGGQDKFHFQPIPDSCYKVDVKEAIWPQVTLMFPNHSDEQTKVKDTVGSSAIWEGKFVKPAS